LKKPVNELTFYTLIPFCLLFPSPAVAGFWGKKMLPLAPGQSTNHVNNWSFSLRSTGSIYRPVAGSHCAGHPTMRKNNIATFSK
jgi:hypothetical protein